MKLIQPLSLLPFSPLIPHSSFSSNMFLLPAGSLSQNCPLSCSLSPSYSCFFVLPSPSPSAVWSSVALWKIAALTRHDLKTHWRFRMLQHSYITVCGCVNCLIPLPRLHTRDHSSKEKPATDRACANVCACQCVLRML